MTEARQLTGWHVAGIFVGAFGIIIGVNIALAVNAVRTFPGLEVKNSYVASQSFDARRQAQLSLGWDVDARIEADRIVMSIKDANGHAVQAGQMTALVGRATNVSDDIRPEFAFDGQDYVAYETLSPGNWDIWIKATALDGTRFEQRLTMHNAH